MGLDDEVKLNDEEIFGLNKCEVLCDWTVRSLFWNGNLAGDWPGLDEQIPFGEFVCNEDWITFENDWFAPGFAGGLWFELLFIEFDVKAPLIGNTLFGGNANLALTASRWSRRATNSWTRSSNLLFSDRNWCRHDNKDAMSKCCAWSTINCDPWAHCLSKSCSNVWGSELERKQKLIK